METAVKVDYIEKRSEHLTEMFLSFYKNYMEFMRLEYAEAKLKKLIDYASLANRPHRECCDYLINVKRLEVANIKLRACSVIPFYNKFGIVHKESSHYVADTKELFALFNNHCEIDFAELVSVYNKVRMGEMEPPTSIGGYIRTKIAAIVKEEDEKHN